MKSVVIREYLSPDLLRDEEVPGRKPEADEVVERLVNANRDELVKSCAGCLPPSPTPWTLATSLPLPTPRWSSKSAAWSRARRKWQPGPAPETSGLSAKNDRCVAAELAKIELRRDW
jgi:hypothetical protein